MPITQTIPIDLNTRGANPVAFTHQGDTARSFVFEVYNNGEAFSLTGYTAKIAAMLPADNGYQVIAGENMATGTISDNTITATLPAEFSAKPGNGVLTIILTGSGESIRPINVDFRIQKSADAPETIAGASDFIPILEQYISEDMATYINAWLDDHPDAAAYYITGSKLVVDSNGILSLETDTDEIVEALDLGTLQSDVDDLKSDLSDINDSLGVGEVDLTLYGTGQINNSGVIATTQNYNLNYFSIEENTSYLVFKTTRHGYFAEIPSLGASAIDNVSHVGSDVNYISGANIVVLQSPVGTTPIVIKMPYQSSLFDKVDNITRTEQIPVNGELTTGKFLSTNGSESSSSTWNYYSVQVNPNEEYTVITTAGQSAKAWLCLDSNNSVIGNSSYKGTPQEVTASVVIPTDGSKLVVNCKSSESATIIKKITTVNENKIIIDSKTLPEKLNEIENLAGGSSDRLYNKTICCVGDSITYGDDMDSDGFDAVSAVDFYQWQGDYHAQYDGSWVQQTTNVRKTWNYIIAKRHNMTLYNGGVNGSTMQGLDNKYGFSLANGRYTKLPDDIDYLLIWFGWNDTAYGTLGAITDTTNESYYGGYNVVLPYLINKYPYTRIGLVVPYGTDVNHRNAIRQLGNKWGVAVWDNYQGGTPLYYGKEDSVGVESSIVTSNRAKFQANGAHPNHFGHEQLADMIEEFLRGI